MEILRKFKEILLKIRKKEEIPQINLKIVDIEPEFEPMDVEPSPAVLESYKKVRTPITHYIKQALRWFNLKDEVGEELIKEESDINLIFSHWSKSLVLWFLNVVMTGVLIYLAILPFYSVSFILIPFIVFSFGLIYYVSFNVLKEVVGVIRGKHG